MTEITITNGLKSVTGEVVLEHSLAWQIAVDGKVRVFQKSEWAEGAGLFGGFDDMFPQFFGGRS